MESNDYPEQTLLTLRVVMYDGVAVHDTIAMLAALLRHLHEKYADDPTVLEKGSLIEGAMMKEGIPGGFPFVMANDEMPEAGMKHMINLVQITQLEVALEHTPDL